MITNLSAISKCIENDVVTVVDGQLGNETHMRDLSCCPSKLEDADDRRVIDGARKSGSSRSAGRRHHQEGKTEEEN